MSTNDFKKHILLEDNTKVIVLQMLANISDFFQIFLYKSENVGSSNKISNVRHMYTKELHEHNTAKRMAIKNGIVQIGIELL